MNWAVLLVVLALILLLVAPVVGLVFYSPDRARYVKRAEARAAEITAQVAYLRLRHPDLVKSDRLDRHDTYLWLNAALGVYGLIVMFGRVPYASYGSGTLGTQHTLAGSLLIGCVMTLGGAALGSHVGRRCIGKWVCTNLVSPILGDDIRVPYVLAWCGLLSTGMSMAFYGYTVIMSAGLGRLLTTLGGVLAITVGAMCFTLIPKFILRIRRYVHARDLLIEEALGRIAQEDA